MAARAAMMMMRRRHAMASAAVPDAAVAGEEEDNDILADIADKLKIDYGEDSLDEHLKASIHKAIDKF